MQLKKERGQTSLSLNYEVYCQIAWETRKLLKKKKFDRWGRFRESICPDVHPKIVLQNIKRFRTGRNTSSQCSLPQNFVNKFLDKLTDQL